MNSYFNSENIRKCIPNSSINEHKNNSSTIISKTQFLHNNINNNMKNSYFDNSVTSSIRISNLENRMISLEKMMQYFDEFLNLKEEEKYNNRKLEGSSIEINNQILSKFNSLEKEISNLKKEKEENKKIIGELNHKIIILEEQIKLNSNDIKNINSNNSKNIYANCSTLENIVNSLSDKEQKLSNLMKDFSNLTENNSEIINNLVDEKFNRVNIYNENKINEILNLIQELNKIIEENEENIKKINISLDKEQNDTQNIIKLISVKEEKINSIDFILEEIKNIKIKYAQIFNEFYCHCPKKEGLNIDN